MTPNGVPPVGATGEQQQVKGKRRQRKGSYSNDEHNGNGLGE